MSEARIYGFALLCQNVYDQEQRLTIRLFRLSDDRWKLA